MVRVRQQFEDAVEAEVQEMDKTGISVEDKLTFKTMEADFYRDQMQASAVQQQVQAKLDGINAFIKTLHEKYGKDQKEYSIDTKSLEFVARPQPEVK